MTWQETGLGLSKFFQGLTNWFSGRMQVGTPGNKVLVTELSQKKAERSEWQSARG